MNRLSAALHLWSDWRDAHRQQWAGLADVEQRAIACGFTRREAAEMRRTALRMARRYPYHTITRHAELILAEMLERRGRQT